MAIPAAAPVPARPTKCSLPMLLENSDAPTCETNTLIKIIIFHFSLSFYERLAQLCNKLQSSLNTSLWIKNEIILRMLLETVFRVKLIELWKWPRNTNHMKYLSKDNFCILIQSLHQLYVIYKYILATTRYFFPPKSNCWRFHGFGESPSVQKTWRLEI